MHMRRYGDFFQVVLIILQPREKSVHVDSPMLFWLASNLYFEHENIEYLGLYEVKKMKEKNLNSLEKSKTLNF